ncbi:response regulator transcription factor [Candidatus Electronema sp. TJ]|uniref:response regulator transcription factor n=1 Tax=Candidatus Electronema sp. TJ TaxID=3401573 RepID=UPI003AA867A9
MPTTAQLDLSITAAACKDNLQPALKQVLIVDDDQHLLHSIQAGLENNSSLRVRTAADGKEVLDIIDSGGLDLVMIDLNMPDMDGLQLLAALSDFSIMTGFGSPMLRQAGAPSVLEKPLEREISKALTGGASCCRLPLEIFLQLVGMEHKTIHIKVFRPDGRGGSLFFRAGLLIDAELDGLTGDSAMLTMLEWQDFTLSLKEYSPLFPELRINSALAYFLLQTSCRLDQHRHSQACLNRARKELRRRQRRDNAEHS